MPAEQSIPARAAVSESPALLEERTIGGLHDYLLTNVFPKFLERCERVVDLGAGSGALAFRLQALGLEVLAVDSHPERFKAPVRFINLNLDETDFASQLSPGSYDLVVSVEVIEHLENPIGFLRNVRRLLRSGGLAILTTPNVDSVPARLKFFLRGKVRLMDEASDLTHISPIFWDLLVRQYVPRAGLEILAHYVYPPHGYQVTRARYAWAFRALAQVLPGVSLLGDNHILVLQPGRTRK